MFKGLHLKRESPSWGSQAGNASQTSCPTEVSTTQETQTQRSWEQQLLWGALFGYMLHAFVQWQFIRVNCATSVTALFVLTPSGSFSTCSVSLFPASEHLKINNVFFHRHRYDCRVSTQPRQHANIKIHQRGLQWKSGVVICVMLYTSLLYNTTRIHCTPLPLHPPLMNIQSMVAEF